MKEAINRKIQIFISVLPWTILFVALKTGAHYLGLETIPKEIMTFFPSALTAIIFILGFLLAGVVTDYKESEKIPNEVSSTVFSLWQEAYHIGAFKKNPEGVKIANSLVDLLKTYKETLSTLNYSNLQNKINDVLGMFLANESDIQPASVIRIKNELLNLKKYLNRIRVIKETDFVPTAFFTIKIVAIIFLVVSVFLKLEPWWGGLLFTGFFSFMIFSVLYLINDLEDPFEYDDGKASADEINLDVIDNMIVELEDMNKKSFS